MNKDVQYSRSLKGLIGIIYKTQILTSKKRGHKLPTYSKVEFINWCESDPAFIRLYKEWVASNFEPKLKPSIGRLNDEISYSIDNIQSTTWDYNRTKGNRAKALSTSKKVSQLNLKGQLVQKYKSITEASNKLGIDRANISAVISGRRKTTGGFIFN